MQNLPQNKVLNAYFFSTIFAIATSSHTFKFRILYGFFRSTED